MTQPTPPTPNPNTPTRKVGAAGIGGAAATVVIWGLNLLGVSVPGEVGAAIGTICAFVAGYFTPEA